MNPVLECKAWHIIPQHNLGDSTGSGWKAHPVEYTRSCLLMERLSSSGFLEPLVQG